VANIMAGYWQKLYRDATPAELALEPAVASLGVPYRFQHPLYLFGPLKAFPDFLLTNERAVLEVDDPRHFTKAGRTKDKIRTAKLVAAGYRVARCTNEEALADPYGTVNWMMRDLGLTHRARPPGLG
jgi:very-short-patch-repair endonuclease